jgi:hypothetical protein
MTDDTRAKIDYARQLYCYGARDGRRVTDSEELARLSGLPRVSVVTLRRQEDWDLLAEDAEEETRIMPSGVLVQSIREVARRLRLLMQEANFLETVWLECRKGSKEYAAVYSQLEHIWDRIDRYSGYDAAHARESRRQIKTDEVQLEIAKANAIAYGFNSRREEREVQGKVVPLY